MSIHINTWPDGQSISNNFKRRQVVLKFKNEWSISIVYGTGLYCSDVTGSQFPRNFDDALHAQTVEVAITDSYNRPVRFQSSEDEVKGWIGADELADIIQWVKTQPRST